ncbi:MAG: Glu-tRNA(Gln) amidotransferase subunit GatD [Candidatus Micrarchaeia archaeon]
MRNFLTFLLRDTGESMYSRKVREQLWKRNIDIGDRVSIEFGGAEREGILLENYSENTDIIELKLDNGYNLGVVFNDTLKLIKKKGALKEKRHGAGKTEDNKEYDIAVLMFGGTVSSRVEYSTGAVFPAATPEEFRESFPEMNTFGGARFKNVMSILSEDMNTRHWKIIGEEVFKELKKGKAVVVTHGTDTLGYSAAAVSFMIRNPQRPVVLTGAQRSSDRGSSDAKENVLNAAFYASTGRPGVYVAMHATTSDGAAHIHLGTRVRKMHTSRRDAFRSINATPVAEVDYSKKKIEYIGECTNVPAGGDMELINKFSENVALVYIHPGIKPSFISKLSDYEGVVLAATGLGHVPSNPFGDALATPIIKEIGELTKSGIYVVIAPQTIYGRLNLNVYTAGRMLKETGVIGHNCDWLPETAFVKLSWVLGQTKERKKVIEMMYTDYAGELRGRSAVTNF